MAALRIVGCFVAAVLGLLVGTAAEASPLPDSAGIVEMVKGYAYGGIPYGSVSGNLANYGSAQGHPYRPHNGLDPTPVLAPNGNGLQVALVDP